MPVQIHGTTLPKLLEVDTDHKAARVSLRPAQVAGSYLIAIAAATAAAPGAAANLVSFRFVSATHLALIRRLKLEMLVTTAATGAGIPEMGAYLARGFSASDSGGTAVSLATNNGKRRTSFVTSQLNLSSGDFRFANAGVLTAGTRTLDALPILNVMAPIGLSTAMQVGEFGGSVEDEPIVLANNEGFVIQNVNAITAGIYRFHVQIEWDEIVAADWT